MQFMMETFFWERNMQEQTSIQYELDEHNIITDVSAAWDQFALENDGYHVMEKHVKGQSLFSFVKGESTKMMIDLLLNKARLLKKTVTHKYRCDSPDCKRYMEMDIVPVYEGKLVLRHRTLRTEKLNNKIAFEFNPQKAHEHKKPMIRCSVCNRIYIKDQWLEPDQAMAKKWLPVAASLPVIYGICNECRENIRAIG